MFCPRCGFDQPDDHRFCMTCGAQLPTHLVSTRVPKITRLFLGIQTSEQDPAGAVLRVSRYMEDHEFSTPEGTIVIPGDHARVSIWHVDRPVAAISVTQSEAAELGRFLLDLAPAPLLHAPATSDA
ncbi:MAG TPA: zinc-ribbon domain-containing protein [Actinomycetota bacterium]|nr:zinc-ribbon domain-containing protein [Actinomycetota bacterium]